MPQRRLRRDHLHDGALDEARGLHLAFEIFCRQIVAQRTYSLASGNGHRAHYWVNKNTLLWNYRGAIGIKTGQAAAAGACLLFEARRGAKTLIGVVLHSSSFSLNAAFSDATKMLNWGFSQ